MKAIHFILIFITCSFIVEAQNSHIQVVAEPGISVFLDGHFKGTTSSDYGGLIIQNVSPGHHEIKVVKDGYSPREEEINVKEGEVLQYNIDNDFMPAIRISEEGNTERQAISIKKGNLTIQSLPISIRIRIPSVNIDYVKKEDKFHADNIPEGTYYAKFILNEKVLSDSVQIQNEMETYLFVNMIDNRIENKDYKHIEASSKESTDNFSTSSYIETARTDELGRIEEQQRRIQETNARSRNAFGNVGNTGTKGNQGVETGTVGVRTYGPSGGTGNSNDSYNLPSRHALSLPLPQYDYKGEGVVVVEVTVDKTGKVTNARAGVAGSTTTDEYLLRVSREAALKARFDSSPNTPIQKGTITYNFKLK